MDRSSSVIVTEIERELPSTVLTEVRKGDGALFETDGYRPPTIANSVINSRY